jgi:hypothetical protein
LKFPSPVKLLASMVQSCRLEVPETFIWEPAITLYSVWPFALWVKAIMHRSAIRERNQITYPPARGGFIGQLLISIELILWINNKTNLPPTEPAENDVKGEKK